MPTTPKFDPAALGLTVETAGYRPASPETGETDTTHQIGYSKSLPGGFTQHYGMNGENLGISKDKSTWESVKPLVAMAGSALLPGLINPMLSGAGLTGIGLSAGTGALTGATIAGVTGGDPLRGALMGGLGGAASNALGQYTAPTQTGDMGQWYDGYSGPASDAGYMTSTAGDAAQWYDGYTGPASDLGYMSDSSRVLRGFDGEEIGGIGSSTSKAFPDGTVSVDTTGPLTKIADASTGTSADKLTTNETARDVRGYDGEEIGGTGSNTSKAFPDGTPSVDVQKSVWEKLGDKVMDKLRDPVTGDINWSNALALAGLAVSTIGKLTASDPPPVSTVGELRAKVVPKDFDKEWTGGALTAAAPWNTRERIYSADMPTPIVAGRRYAEGGEVEGALSVAPPFVGFVQGEGGGQDDLIDASLSAGEYVFDAESVSMLGDGNNEEGARKLDELRASLRAHKRSAPDDKIAPPAQGALSYMNGGQ